MNRIAGMLCYAGKRDAFVSIKSRIPPPILSILSKNQPLIVRIVAKMNDPNDISTLWFVIASPRNEGVTIQLDGLLRRSTSRNDKD
jgi:hypothetical protein